jgi:micrococcal nuclease
VFESDLRPARFAGAGFAGVTAEGATWPGDREPVARISPDPETLRAPALKAPSTTHVERVVGVEDGDTVELARSGPARLIGVDSPDLGDPLGDAAREFAVERLEDQRVEVQGGTDGVDAFGRKLVYLWTPDGGSFNQALLETGNATLLPADPFAVSALDAAEERAKQLGLGYWSSCPTTG